MDFDLDALLDDARLPEKTVPLCLRGDLQSQWEALEARLIERRTSTATLADAESAELAQRMRALEDTMRKATVTFTLRAMDRRTWSEVRGQHPPREKVRTDQVLGVNEETFFPAIIRASIVDPVMTVDQFEKLLDKISDGQYQKLADTAWNLSRQDVSVPFSPTASLTAPTSGATSPPPSG